MNTKLKRCGACGSFQQNPKFYSQDEQDNPILIHCGCEQDEPRYVSIDMAIDAGEPEMEGMRI